jgi:hypothetical protein
MLTKKLNKNYECFYSLIIILNLSVVVNYNNKSYFEYIASLKNLPFFKYKIIKIFIIVTLLNNNVHYCHIYIIVIFTHVHYYA